MSSINFLIPTHGRASLLERTLASLAECSIPEGYVETVVIENGPKSGAEDTVAAASSQWPHLNLRYLHVSRANKSHALNVALSGMGAGCGVRRRRGGGGGRGAAVCCGGGRRRCRRLLRRERPYQLGG